MHASPANVVSAFLSLENTNQSVRQVTSSEEGRIPYRRRIAEDLDPAAVALRFVMAGRSTKADLSPPLGYPGGPCHLIERIDDALDGPAEEALIEKVEEAEDLSNTDANHVYKPEVDRGATGTQFKKLVLTPHAQYRMDLRGITIPQIRMTLKGFHDHYSKEKSQNSPTFEKLDMELRYTREIKWVDKKTDITLVFVTQTLGGDRAARIITCYRAGEDESRIDRSECGDFEGWAGEYEDSGNLFAPDPKSVLAKFAAEARSLVGYDKEAWKRRWQSGHRMHHQHGAARAKARAYYRRNKSKIRAKARQRRNRLKNNGAYKASERLRRRQNRHMISSITASADVVAANLCSKEAAKFSPSNQRGGPGGGRQHEQPTRDRLQDHRDYLRGREQKKNDARKYYEHECKPNGKCMDRREKIRNEPQKYERGAPLSSKRSSVLTAPDIAFTLLNVVSIGYVHDLSPMTGMVTYQMDRDGTKTLESMSVEVFLRAVVFLSDEDMDAFFELVDTELGDEAYGPLSHEGVRECADLFGVDHTSEDFRARCKELVGGESLEDMDLTQLDLIQERLTESIIEGLGSEELEDRTEEVYGVPEESSTATES